LPQDDVGWRHNAAAVPRASARIAREAADKNFLNVGASERRVRTRSRHRRDAAIHTAVAGSGSDRRHHRYGAVIDDAVHLVEGAAERFM
jgi:hypothetical protein